MLCEKCGAYMAEEAITCERCGTLLKRKPQPEPGVRGMRQGRLAGGSQPAAGGSRVAEPAKEAPGRREAAPETVQMYREDRRPSRRRGVERFSEDAGRPQSRRGIPRISENAVRKLQIRQDKARPVRKHMVNWMYVLAALVVVFFMSLVGGFLYLTRSPAGQQVLARMGRNAPAQAYWRVGDSYMDEGLVDKAIAAFKTADGQDPNNVDGLLSLAAAYEAVGRVEEAQELYIHLYEKVSPERPEAYREQIRMLIASDRSPEAAELMKLAHEKTGLSSFRLQRDALLPKIPETDLSAGRYTEEQVITLTSDQAYDIMYLIGEGEYPADYTLYEEPIVIGEGQHRIRAVCISRDLVSDPLDVTYTVVLPSPDAPKSGLQPGTYERKQRVWLRYPGKEKDITMYYTLDGSTPDTNSPRYTGDPIPLPGGKVTLKAIAVGSNGKSSNVMEVGYKIQNVAFRMMYSSEDTFAGFALMQTSWDAFVNANGQPVSQENVSIAKLEAECKKLNYDWGHCIVANIGGKWLVVEVYQTQEKFAPPRKTHIGASEEEITAQFRDMGQPNNQDGSRSLYKDGNDTGMVVKVSDTEKNIQYILFTVESYKFLLQYHVKDGIVTAVTHRYIP